MNPIPVLNVIIELLTVLGVGIRTTKTVIDEFKTLFPQYKGLTDSELIDKYEIRLGVTRAKLEQMLRN